MFKNIKRTGLMPKVDTKNPNVKKLLLDIKDKCKLNKITFMQIDQKTLMVGNRISGYFDHSCRELAFASKSKIALEVLIHESCHLDQYVSNCDDWMEIDIPYKHTSLESQYLFDLWLIGAIDVRDEYVDKMVKRIMDLERDCEKRSIRKILKYKLQDVINIEEYVQKANSYVLGYQLIREKRRWFKKSPYSIEGVWRTFPKRTIKEGYRMTESQRKIMLKHCF